jgi:hypothetical protein
MLPDIANIGFQPMIGTETQLGNNDVTVSAILSHSIYPRYPSIHRIIYVESKIRLSRTVLAIQLSRSLPVAEDALALKIVPVSVKAHDRITLF